MLPSPHATRLIKFTMPIEMAPKSLDHVESHLDHVRMVHRHMVLYNIMSIFLHLVAQISHHSKDGSHLLLLCE